MRRKIYKRIHDSYRYEYTVVVLRVYLKKFFNSATIEKLINTVKSNYGTPIVGVDTSIQPRLPQEANRCSRIIYDKVVEAFSVIIKCVKVDVIHEASYKKFWIVVE